MGGTSGGSERNLPSTYQQVLANMRRLGRLSDENKDVNLAPCDYDLDITYELKSAMVLGLSTRRGVTKDYLTLMTVAPHAEDANAAKWQLAYGDKYMELFYRSSTSNNTWGAWVDVLRRQFVDSKNMPTDQEPGDYWMEPLDGNGSSLPDIPGPSPGDPTDLPSGYYMQDVDTNTWQSINEDLLATLQFMDIDSGTTDRIGDLGDYSIVDPVGVPEPQQAGYYVEDLDTNSHTLVTPTMLAASQFLDADTGDTAGNPSSGNYELEDI